MRPAAKEEQAMKHSALEEAAITYFQRRFSRWVAADPPDAKEEQAMKGYRKGTKGDIKCRDCWYCSRKPPPKGFWRRCRYYSPESPLILDKCIAAGNTCDHATKSPP